jgi:hypothetical protein
MIVHFFDESYECEKAVKGSDFIRLFDSNNNCIVSFEGVNDLNAFTIENGELSEAEPTAEERIAELEMQNQMLMECLLEMSEVVYA